MNVSKFILSFILSMTIFTQVSFAQMASTEALFQQSDTASPKEKIAQFMIREDVSKQFEKMGVDQKMLNDRIASMTDAEISKISYQIDTLPAGGDGGATLIGAVVFIFVLLLITDILGLTKVFNFTKPITHK